MGSHRKLLLPHLFGSVKYDGLTPPPLLLQRPPPHPSIAYTVPLLVVVIGAAMFFSVFFMTITRYLRNRRVRRSLRDPNIHRDPPILFNTQEDFIDEEQGPHLDHPIWYIRTVGLDQSTIDAIAVFKYKKGEGLVDGTDCSVCLSEFQEDEDLRLLPKCSHAFHVDCIDMWLRSHKNCPLCRAPVIRAAAAATAEEPRTANSGPVDTAIEESIENRNVGDEVEEDENSGSGESREMVISLPSSESSEIGDVCDSTDGSRLAGHEREEVQGVRRSVSVDAASASEIYLAVEAAVCSSSIRRQRIKKGKNLSMNLNLSSNSNSNSRVIGSCSFRLYRMMKSCSFRSSAHEDFSTTRMLAHPAGRCDVPKNPNSDRAGERSCRSIELSAAEGMEKQ